ncbi:hypothetical protein NXS19_004774 [Fusarium pseudograminearum]|nr:hypothetical protein NXS19_004774 [Fusarium pseudograminearum]
MDSNTSNTVASLTVADGSKVQVGNNNTTYNNNTTHNYNTTRNYNTTHNSESNQDDKKELLQALGSTDPRHDKTDIEQRNNDLLREAYIWILKNPEFLAWRDGNDERQLLWIEGDAGKGKTMLLCGIIDELRSYTRLGHSDSHTSLSFFFCQATDSKFNNATAVMRGLIYLLVVQQPCLLSHLRDNIHWESRVAIEDLFRKIVADPALEEAYLIVDALDECREEDLQFLLPIIRSPLPRIKWIVSSRNRLQVEEGLEQSSSKLSLSLEINEASVSQAVEYFVNHRTDELAKRKKLNNDETQQIKRYLIQHAHGTFLWVGLVCRHLQRCEAWEISGQLSQSQLPMGLNKLYATMMMQISASNSREQYIGLLAIVSTVFRPLTFSELKAMAQLDFDEQRLIAFVRQCGSFLTTRGATVIFVHQSAKDFLMKESSELLFQSGLAQHHYDLFRRSLDVLDVLQKDMYGLVYPGVSLDEALRNRPETDPLGSLKYALVFWTDHIREAYRLSTEENAGSKMPFAETVYNFFCKRFLFWLEALSLSQNIPVAGTSLLSLKGLPGVCSSPISLEQRDVLSGESDAGLQMPFAKNGYKSFLKRVLSQFQRHRLSSNTPVAGNYLVSREDLPAQAISEPSLLELIEDVLRFLHLFRPAIETHPLQIYTSGLLFSPQNSIIRNLFKDSTPSFIKRGPKVDDDWSPMLGVFDTSPGTKIRTMIFSDKDDTVVMTTSDSQLLMWNINTGHVHRDSRYNYAKSLRPSPDLQLLAIITTQNVLEVCELNSRNVLWTVKLSSPFVLAMEFAPDSQWLTVCHDYNLYLYDREGRLCQSWTLETELIGPASYHLSYSLTAIYCYASDRRLAAILLFSTFKQECNIITQQTLFI